MKPRALIFRLLNFHRKSIKRIPDNKKCCVTIFHDYEREYANEEYGKFADTGLDFILNVEKKYGIKATYNIVGKICETYPETVKRIQKEGHDIASHANLHETPKKVSGNILEKSVIDSKKAFADLGIGIVGFRSPESGWDKRLLALLQKNGYRWNAESDHSNSPYFIKKDLLRIPISYDDWGYRKEDMGPEQFLKELKEKVESGKRNRGYVAIGFHPWVQAMKKERLKVFEDFISWLTDDKEIKIMTFSEIDKFCRN